MKEQILKLRSEGKPYREIQKIVKCSRSLISYYINPNGKSSNLARQNKNRFRRRSEYKQMLGGKCCLCGYDKCINALQFHHKDPSQKKFGISDSIFGKGQQGFSDEDLIAEIQKCMLVCANCHFELHALNDFNEHH